MNLITCRVAGTAERPVVEFAEHSLAIDPRALERYPLLARHVGQDVIVGIRPEHFAMEGDVELPDDQHLTVRVELAEAMGAEVHVHTAVDVPPVAVEGAPTANEDVDPLDTEITRIIARVEGIHVVENESDVRLGVKTHLLHFFDPSTGQPLR